ARQADDENGSEIGEMIPLLKDVVCQMAFPITEPTNVEYQLVEKAILEAHHKVGREMGLKDVMDWFADQAQSAPEESRSLYRNIAIQLEPYAVGRLSVWFNGE